ncbi:MAG: hypothetical protein HKO53_20390, partial [Gemmatimonadetes bacterium]|nr:hypothetical protein [Gemmatimonadota bacterium]
MFLPRPLVPLLMVGCLYPTPAALAQEFNGDSRAALVEGERAPEANGTVDL